MLSLNLPALELELTEAFIRLVVLAGLILVVAFFVAAELALVSASRSEIRHLAAQADNPTTRQAAERVREAQSQLEHYLSVTQTGTTAGSLLLGWLGEGATVHWIEPWTSRLPLDHVPAVITAHSIAVTIAFLLVTYVEIALGELVPKVLATNAPERTALMLIRPLQFCSSLFWPLLVILNGTVRLLTRGIDRRQATHSDLPGSEAAVIQTDSHTTIVSGSLEITALNHKLHLNLPASKAYTTAAGLMIHLLGHAPHQGECLVWGELELQAARVNNHRLERVLIRQTTRPLMVLPEPTSESMGSGLLIEDDQLKAS